jgi:ATP-dependent RNA helicase RhlE
MTAFANLKLLPSLQTTLAERGIDKPTEIQRLALPLLLSGRSVVGISETGSGKTLSYALPILHLLKNLESQGEAVSVEAQPRAAVIVPTRELGEQVARVFKIFTHATRLRVRSVLGGTAMEVARRNVQGPFEVLVATPGRLLQMMDRNQVNLSDVRFLVFDEADQMLDQGFLTEATRIVDACPAERQLALFTATASDAVQQLIGDLFQDAELVRSSGSHRTVASLTTVNRSVKNGKRFPLIEKLLSEKVSGGTLIFTNTREQCDKLALELQAAGFACVIYRGEMDKIERRANLKAFRDGKIEFLVSTDLASRGLDVEHVGRVINYHLPQQMENYIHRVGRTARAGRTGVVVNLVTERDAKLMKQLESVQPTTPRSPSKAKPKPHR